MLLCGLMKPLSADESRRESILAAATRVFGTKGLAGSSMRMIAREAACTTGAIYPVFEGKEAIYAALLERSLTGLHTQVALACAAQADPLEALEAAASAWHGYYIEHLFEAELGLYMHTGEGIYGLGSERNTMLNALLLQTLDIFRACFMRLATELGIDNAQAWATAERDRLFAELIGILMLTLSRRTESIGTSSDTLVQNCLRAQRERLQVL